MTLVVYCPRLNLIGCLDGRDGYTAFDAMGLTHLDLLAIETFGILAHDWIIVGEL